MELNHRRENLIGPKVFHAEVSHGFVSAHRAEVRENNFNCSNVSHLARGASHLRTKPRLCE